MCAECVQAEWVCVTDIKNHFIRNTPAWKINPTTCATKICHQVIRRTHLESAVFLGVEECSGRFYPTCYRSGEDLYISCS